MATKPPRPRLWAPRDDPFAVQVAAWGAGRDRDRFGYWLEQGLGKTSLDLADFAYHLGRGRVDSHLVVAPTYLASGWRDEVRKQGIDVPVFLWPNFPSEREQREPHIAVIYPEACLYSGGERVDEMIRSRPYMFTIDESSMIKTHTGRWSKRLMEWRTHTPVMRSLTGTPMSQSVMDLWAQLRFCGAIEGWNPYQFRNHFAVMGGYMGRQILPGPAGYRNVEELHSLMDGHVFRATKEDWWDDCPEKIYPPPVEYEMTKTQRRVYEDMRRDFVAELDARGTQVTVDQAVHMRLKLQQISRGFVYGEDGSVHHVVDPGRNPSILATRAAVEVTRGKVLIFAHYVRSCGLLRDAFRDMNPAVLTGGMDAEEVAREKLRFNEDPDCRVFILQDQVGARGHTLLGGPGDDRCSTTLFYENSYSLETRSQAEDRCVAEGSPVLTPTGWVPIEKLGVGDEVITHLGSAGVITDAWNRGSTKPMAEVSVEGWPWPIVVTHDHEFLRTDGTWVRADALLPGDRVAVPNGGVPECDAGPLVVPDDCRISGGSWDTVRLPDSIPADSESLFVFGYYVGDGFCRTDRSRSSAFVSLAGNSGRKAEHLDRCEYFMRGLGIKCGARTENGGGREMRCYSAEMASLISGQFGRIRSEKRLPKWCLSMSRRQSEWLLSGLVASDGYARGGRIEYASKGDDLAAQVAILMTRCGRSPMRTFYHESAGGVNIVAFNSGAVASDGHVVRSILLRNARRVGNDRRRERVYDLTVEPDSSYVVGLSSVHNCHRWGQDRAVVYRDLSGCPEDFAVVRSLQMKQLGVDEIVNSIRGRAT